MRMTKRRKLGLALAGVSIIVAATLQLLTGRVVRAETEHEERFQLGQDWMAVSMTTLHYNPYCAVPLALCFALGVACALWPARKPPRLAS
jgi:hypothetical protein